MFLLVERKHLLFSSQLAIAFGRVGLGVNTAQRVGKGSFSACVIKAASVDLVPFAVAPREDGEVVTIGYTDPVALAVARAGLPCWIVLYF